MLLKTFRKNLVFIFVILGFGIPLLLAMSIGFEGCMLGWAALFAITGLIKLVSLI